MPELPEAKRNRYRNDFGIKDEDIESYIVDKELGDWFEKVALKLNNKDKIKVASNYITEDFAGLKLRGYGELPSETIKALGASPVTMGSGEVYMAIQRGVVDGQTSGTTAMYDRKMFEVTKYLTITNHAYPEFILAMNEKSFQKTDSGTAKNSNRQRK